MQHILSIAIAFSLLRTLLYRSPDILVLVPPPHLGVSLELLVPAYEYLMRTQPLVSLDHASNCHKGHLYKADAVRNMNDQKMANEEGRRVTW